MDWDDPLPDEIIARWERWRTELPLLEKVKLNRCVKPPGFGSPVQAEVHSFSDACESGIGQVSYLRTVNSKGDVHVGFLIAKSRVAPIKPMSILRMELTAAVVSVNVTKMLQSELDYENLRSVYYTDSEVVIGYISNEARRFHVYVGNRVQHIRDRSDPEQWHHVPGKDNPADEASRSLTASQLLNKKRWLSGPDFLWESDVPLLNKKNTAQLSSDDVEVKTSTCLLTHSSAREYPGLLLLSYLNRVSSWHKAKTTVAWMRRGIKILQSVIAASKEEIHSAKHSGRSRNEQGKQFLPLSVEELVHSEKFILRCLQCQYFSHEMETLTNLKGNLEKFQERDSARRRNDTLKKKSSLYKLDPFVDKNGLLRIGGRIRRADVPLEVKHPLILPKKSHISDLIVRYFHESVGHHQGRGVTHNTIRQAGYWIVDGRSTVARTISKCVTCR